MQYLLIDTLQRPLGTMNRDKSFAVGDTLQNRNAEVFTVVGLNWFKQRTHAQSLTIIPGQVQLKAKTT